MMLTTFQAFALSAGLVPPVFCLFASLGERRGADSSRHFSFRNPWDDR